MKFSTCLLAIALALLAFCSQAAMAHDTWVQTNTNLIRTGDAVHIDLMLGNHGNDHRDYKLASKIDRDGVVLKVRGPDGKSYDLADRLVDTGYTPKEGFWTTKFAATAPGMYVVEHSLDKIVHHGRPVRSVRSGKTCFVVSRSLDKIPLKNSGFDTVLGHPLEIIPVKNPVAPAGPGQRIHVRVLFQGKPFAKAKVSFIPRSETLKPDHDPQYERETDAQGEARFTPLTGDYFLIAVHHRDEKATGPGYEATHYSATLNVFVPEACPCCGE
jgi:uncharacterized GH25 family protein